MGLIDHSDNHCPFPTAFAPLALRLRHQLVAHPGRSFAALRMTITSFPHQTLLILLGLQFLHFAFQVIEAFQDLVQLFADAAVPADGVTRRLLLRLQGLADVVEGLLRSSGSASLPCNCWSSPPMAPSVLSVEAGGVRSDSNSCRFPSFSTTILSFPVAVTFGSAGACPCAGLFAGTLL